MAEKERGLQGGCKSNYHNIPNKLVQWRVWFLYPGSTRHVVKGQQIAGDTNIADKFNEYFT